MALCAFITHNPQRQWDYEHTWNIGVPMDIQYFYSINHNDFCVYNCLTSAPSVQWPKVTCVFSKTLASHIKLCEINILTYTSRCFPSSGPTLLSPCTFCLLSWARAKNDTFLWNGKLGNVVRARTKVNSHADYITPLCSGSSGIRSSQLKPWNEKLNDCLQKVKFSKQSIETWDHGSWVWLIMHLKV